MSELLDRLGRKERRGSKPRCHSLTHGSASDVAIRLTALAAPFATVSADERWMPVGFDDLEEAQLHRAPRLLDPTIGKALKSWWMPVASPGKTPNFDIASTCRIDGTLGLLLVEAKAHDKELNDTATGRSLDESEDRAASHITISAAIEAARTDLERATSLPWRISRDVHYQMSNRFAWAWKLTELGFPVVLVYLGFVRAHEMMDRGRPFADHADWERLVKAHSAELFPEQVWGQRWTCHGRAFVPLIRSLDEPLP